MYELDFVRIHIQQQQNKRGKNKLINLLVRFERFFFDNFYMPGRLNLIKINSRLCLNYGRVTQ